MKKSVVLGLLSLSLLVVLSTSAWAQGVRGGAMGGGRFGRLGLLRIEQVQTAMDLSDETKEKIAEILEDAMPSEGGGGPPDMEAIQAAEKEILSLLDDSQKKRLTGIFIQAAGTRALLDNQVAESLNIDDDLKEEISGKLEDLGSGMREKMREIFENAGDDREGSMKKVQELRAEMDKEVLALLSDEQRKLFEDLKGEKVELPQMGGRGFGGGRQGGGGGRPGAGGRPGGGGGEGGARPQRPGGGGEGGKDGGGL